MTRALVVNPRRRRRRRRRRRSYSRRRRRNPQTLRVVNPRGFGGIGAKIMPALMDGVQASIGAIATRVVVPRLFASPTPMTAALGCIITGAALQIIAGGMVPARMARNMALGAYATGINQLADQWLPEGLKGNTTLGQLPEPSEAEIEAEMTALLDSSAFGQIGGRFAGDESVTFGDTDTVF